MNCKKNIIYSMALILLLTISTILFTLPNVCAQTTKETYPFMIPIDNPIGVNQQALLWFGITDMVVWPQTGWKDLTITVTKPDGSTETLGPFNTDTTGGTGTIYTPTMVGTYSLQVHFPEQINEYEHSWRTAPAGTVMKASIGEIVTLTVQEDPLEYFSGFELPEEYWTRPINAQFREWYTISGSYLFDAFPATFGTPYPHSVFQPYNQGPETAHILWRRQDVMGGLAGGERGEHGFSDGTAYEAAWSAYVIGGILYRNVAWPRYSHYQAVRAIDLRTGEELWFKEGIRMNFGQLMYWDTMNMHGVFAYVWETDGNTWRAYDAYTGEWWYTMENVPTGPIVYGPKGEILVYTVDLNNNWMTIWNSTAAYYKWQLDLEGDNPEAEYHAQRWRPYGTTFDASYGLQLNVSIPADLPGVLKVIREDIIVGSNVRAWEVAADPVVIWAISIESGREGELLFKESYQVPGNRSRDIRDISVEDGVFVVIEKETRQWYGYDLTTGAYIWGPSNSQSEADHFGFGQVNWIDVIAYGKLYSGSYGGVLHAYDVNTGVSLWNYTLYDDYAESLMGTNWALGIHFISDGKIYLGHFVHSAFDPLPRGAPTVCIDAETGEEIWRIDMRTGNFMGTYRAAFPVIGDGVMVIQNSYDMNDYAIARGPSETKVSIENDVVKLGSSAMIKGTVMDISPGTEDKGLTLRFPNGVPAVSDTSMSDWMQYVYMQYPRPTDITGVPVKIEIIDPNGEYAWIGTAISDADGNFVYSFIPQIKGQYMIIASFDGSGGYYGSHAMTYLQVDSALAPVSIPQYPGYQGPSAQEVAQNVVDCLPEDPTPEQISQAVVAQLPDFPEAAVIPEYTTIDLVIIVAVVAVAVLVVYTLICVKKQK